MILAELNLDQHDAHYLWRLSSSLERSVRIALQSVNVIPTLITNMAQVKGDSPCVYIWGTKDPEERVRETLLTQGVRVVNLEDGFVRSIGLGRLGESPASVCFDDLGIYYDSSRPSRLENFLYEIGSGRKCDLELASQMIHKIIEFKISKYNFAPHLPSAILYGRKKTKPRVLVLGQVEEDQSIHRGCSQKMTNNELVELAYEENPGCEIIYKIHPDVLNRLRRQESKPDQVRSICRILELNCSVASAFETIDRVYTMSSLTGFEAVLRGIPVTCLGAPFYSGWGLTEDRDPRAINRRRVLKRDLTVEEVFYASYIHYPVYLNLSLAAQASLSDILSNIQVSQYNLSMQQFNRKVKVERIRRYLKTLRGRIKRVINRTGRTREFH